MVSRGWALRSEKGKRDDVVCGGGGGAGREGAGNGRKGWRGSDDLSTYYAAFLYTLEDLDARRTTALTYFLPRILRIFPVRVHNQAGHTEKTDRRQITDEEACVK